MLGFEAVDVDTKDSVIDEGREEDSGDVLWDLHDEQEQLESYQQACSSTTSQLGFQKVGQTFSLKLLFKSYYFSPFTTLSVHYVCVLPSI